MLGRLIVLDGVDGSGKTTMSRLLFDDLIIRKIKTTLVRMPGGTKLGSELRALVKSPKYAPDPLTERLMFAADFAQCVFEVIYPALERDETVICDRCALVTDLVYGPASGIPSSLISTLHDILPSLDIDLCLIMDIPAELAIQRKEAQHPQLKLLERCRIEERGKQFLAAVAKGYAELTVAPEGVKVFKHINANRPPEQVYADILAAATSVISKLEV